MDKDAMDSVVKPKAARGRRAKAVLPETEPVFDRRFREKLDEYAKHFNLEDLNDANDKSLLHIMIKTELMIEDLQTKIQGLIDEDAIENAANIKKLADLLRDATSTITGLQRTLAIDRKARKSDETTSLVDYIENLRENAASFLEERLIKVYCPNCKVMVGRFSPVHKHTQFTVSVQCSQCGKMARARRDERDVFFDIKDSEWRKKYKAEVVQPKAKSSGLELSDQQEISADDGVVIVAELGNSVDHDEAVIDIRDVVDYIEVGS